MSELRKWLSIMESVPATFANQPTKDNRIKRDATVMVDPRVGGGTGRFMHYTPTGAMVDIKGVARDLAEDEFSLPERDYEGTYQKGNDWSHATEEPDTIGTMNDKPEFRPGDMVKIADVYGSVIGPGFGVFIAYSTSGQECIVSFDNKEIVVPTANVGSVLEQDAKDNFGEMDNDGNLSPMSLGSKNVKIEEPAMDHRDDFSKWMATVETALRDESAPVLDEDMPAVNECGCGSWDCPACFPQQDEMPGMHGSMDGMGAASPASVCPTCGQEQEPEPAPEPVCPTCGHDHGAGDEAELVQVDMEPEGMDVASFGMEEDEMSALDDGMQVDEEPMEMEQKPASEKGRNGGVKLGSIVQKFVPADSAGEESPLTHGEDNLAEGPGDADFDGPEELEMGSPMSGQDYSGAMEQMAPEEAMEMISEIKYMQNMGLSMAPKAFSEDEMAAMNPSQLKKTLDMVRGNVSEEDDMMQDPGMDAATGGTLGAGAAGGGGGGHYAPGTAPTMPESIQQGKPTMENIDKDIGTWLNRFKAYDELRASKVPVMEKKKKPDFLDFDKDEDKKEPMTKALKDKEKKEDVKEGADQETLDWMKRFSKLGNMKGYGR